MAMRLTRPLLLFGLLCLALSGCTDHAATSSLTPRAPTPDEKVMLLLDYYEPMYKMDADGHVTELRLIWRHLPKEVVAEIGKLTELVMIDFAGTTLTDDGLSLLKDLHKLRSFGLGNTWITDNGLVHLEKLPGLERVWLTKQRITPEGADRLRAARPDLTVYVH